jgi:ribosome-associated heat shock protein Hsp15
VESTRIDRWLCAVRIYKDRPHATDACRGGHVKLNGAPAKPASAVKVGDRIEARVGDRVRIVEIAKVIEKRVGAPVAAQCLIDHTPVVEPVDREATPFERQRGTGRPTKRDRRELEEFRRRS